LPYFVFQTFRFPCPQLPKKQRQNFRLGTLKILPESIALFKEKGAPVLRVNLFE
jgi:hypothetical protein